MCLTAPKGSQRELEKELRKITKDEAISGQESEKRFHNKGAEPVIHYGALLHLFLMNFRTDSRADSDIEGLKRNLTNKLYVQCDGYVPDWKEEINYLGQMHPNLVKLVGYCLEEDHGLQVYSKISDQKSRRRTGCVRSVSFYPLDNKLPVFLYG
ncbi:hypothetical protein AgCh_013375 [Apium graveolens]